MSVFTKACNLLIAFPKELRPTNLLGKIISKESHFKLSIEYE